MALGIVTSPHSYYPDFTTGRPVFFGQIFVGEPDTDPVLIGNQKQITLRQEDGTLVPVSQPVLTSAGGVPIYQGSPVDVMVDGNYSTKVLSSQGAQVYFIENAFEGLPVTSDEVFLRSELSRQFSTVSEMVADTETVAGQIVSTADYTLTSDGGGNQYLARDTTSGPYNTGSLIASTGNPAIEFVGLFPGGKMNVNQWGLIADWDGATGTDNTPIYQDIIDRMANLEFNAIDFLEGEYYFAPVSGKSTCIFIPSETDAWTREPNPTYIGGNGTIVIDNDGANNVWMSGPDGDGNLDPANDVNIIGNLKIVSSIVDRVTFDSPQTTMPNFGIGFNVSRWYRSSFKFQCEFAKGIVQAPIGDGLYDSTNGFAQQIVIEGCKSTHHQENFIEFTQGFSIDILRNTIERGNGGIDMQRSSGQSFFRTRVVGNTIQGNGTSTPFKCNFGVGFTFNSNYMESNRTASGVAAVHVSMSANNIQDLNSLTFEGNFFSQNATNLDGFGADYAHVELDAFDNFFPKGNNFTGGNGYKLTNSTGRVYSEGETYTPTGSIFSEGDITTGGTISGVTIVGSAFNDPADNVSHIDACKRSCNEMGFDSMEAVNIADGTAFTFRKPGRGIFMLSCRFTNVTQTIFSAADSGDAPLVMAEPAGSLFDYSATPSVPAGGRIDVAVNATNDGITVYNNLGSDRNFVMKIIAAQDWV